MARDQKFTVACASEQYAGNMKQSRWGVVVLLALAASVAMTGCSIAPTGGATGGGTGGGGQSGQTDGGETSGDSTDDAGGTESGDSSSPGDIDLDQFGSLPDTFPRSEVPIIDNPVEMGVDLGTGWSVMMKVDDFAAAFTEASTLLKGAGFEVVAEQLSDVGGVGVFQNEKYQAQISASDSPDNGPVLTYVVIVRG